MKVAVEHIVNPSNLNYLSENAYDSTKWNLGRGLIFNNGATAIDKYITPDFGVLRPVEESTAFTVSQIAAYNLNTNTGYIFGVESITTASVTRRIMLWEFNRKTGAKSWKGFITITLASATGHTVRDFKIDVKNESTGTVEVGGTLVTGTGTFFNTNKVAIGARIGFGSTDPGQITTWYRITSKASDTGALINVSAGTIPAGTSYVIQEFRPIYVATNATLTNGGVHYGKGISIEDFTITGTTIPLATTVDDQKAIYWLKDASTQTNNVAAGCGVNFAAATPTSLDAYVLDLVSVGNYKVYKYNLRAALTVASGASTNAWVLTTGNNPFTGTGSQNANCVFANVQHGLGNGIDSLYFVSTTRVMRASVSGITSGSTTWISEAIIETAPGGSSTFPTSASLNSIEYVEVIDSFIIPTSAVRLHYLTKFVSSGTQFDKQFGRDQLFQDQSLKDNGHPSIFTIPTSATSAYTTAGGNRVFCVRQGTVVANNQIYTLTMGADWDFALQSNGRLITPEIPITNALKFYRVVPNLVTYMGSANLGKDAEAVRLYARTSSITTDQTTGWALLDVNTMDLSAFGAASSIQFAIEFKTLGDTCLPARFLGLNVIYEDNTTDNHFAFSREKSSVTSKQFGFRHRTAYGSTVPDLTIRLYNDVTGGIILTDTTNAPSFGTWEKTTDGTTWAAYNNTDKTNETTYIRYTPTSIADNIIVAAYLTQG